MANIRRKTINLWDGGIKTSPRDNNPDTSDGAQVIKGFDIYKDSKKLVPMQSWESFTTTEEKAYNIRAVGGLTDTIYGLGKGLSNWYGSAWSKRIRVDISAWYSLGGEIPIHLDMSLLPSDFWSNVNSDMSDVRITTSDGQTGLPQYIENLDYAGNTGDMWISGQVSGGSTVTERQSFTTSNTYQTIDNAGSNKYAVDFPIYLDGSTFNTLTFAMRKVSGSTGSVVVSLWSDTAGSPNALVYTLGTVSSSEFESYTVGKDVTIGFTDKTLTGNYHIMFTCPTASSGNSIGIMYLNSGTRTINYASTSTPGGWSLVSATATPRYTLSYSSKSSSNYFYIYYGNSTASAINYGTPTFDYTQGSRGVFNTNSIRFNYLFGTNSDVYDKANKYYGMSGEEFLTQPHLHQDGLVSSAIRTLSTVIETDYHDNIYISGSSISFSFTLYVETLENVTLLATNSAYWIISLTNTGKITFFVDAVSGGATKTSTQSIEVGKWNTIDCVYNNSTQGYEIYINGYKEEFIDNNGAYSAYASQEAVRVNTGASCAIGQVVGYKKAISFEQIKEKYWNFTRSDFFTIGSEESFSSIDPNYDGVQLYAKSITSGDWYEYLEGGRPVKSMNYSPVNAFVDDFGTYFVVSQNPENGGFEYMARRDSQEIADFNHLLLSVWSNSSHTVIQSENAIDGETYFNATNTTVGKVGDPGDSDVFDVPSFIETMTAWRTYLAVGYSSRNFGFIQTWDLAADTQAVEKVNVGTGNLRILGNASDILFSVQDNFIDDVVKSGNKPTMEIKQYIGNGSMETTHTIEIPAVITTYDDAWERAVSNFKIKRNTQTLFYARLPNNEAGTTFNEGFWSIGKNTRGQLSLALQIDTQGLGMPENVFAFAQQVFFIAKDGGIYRLSDDTYNNTALFTSLKMNEGNTDIEKKLLGVEVVTEPLESGQTISVYYKKNGDTERTKIFDMTGEGEISYETTYDINENNLSQYREIEFDVESSGGKAGVLEFNYRYEYLSSMV